MFLDRKTKVWTKPASYSIRKVEVRDPDATRPAAPGVVVPSWVTKLGTPLSINGKRALVKSEKDAN